MCTSTHFKLKYIDHTIIMEDKIYCLLDTYASSAVIRVRVIDAYRQVIDSKNIHETAFELNLNKLNSSVVYSGVTVFYIASNRYYIVSFCSPQNRTVGEVSCCSKLKRFSVEFTGLLYTGQNHVDNSDSLTFL